MVVRALWMGFQQRLFLFGNLTRIRILRKSTASDIFAVLLVAFFWLIIVCFSHLLIFFLDSRSAFGPGQNQEALQFLLVEPVMFLNQGLRFYRMDGT